MYYVSIINTNNGDEFISPETYETVDSATKAAQALANATDKTTYVVRRNTIIHKMVGPELQESAAA